MRILVVSNLYPPEVIGGYELICAGVVGRLADLGHEVEVLTSDRGGPRDSDRGVRRQLTLRMRGEVVRPHPLLRLPSERRDHRALARIPDWDVAIVFHMLGLSKSLLTELHRRGPVVYLLADLWPAWDLANDSWLGRLDPSGPPGTPERGAHRLRWPSLAARALAPLAKRLGVPTEWPDLYREGLWLAGSEWIREQLTGHRGLPLERCRVVPIGFPIDQFPQRDSDPGGHRLLYVGRITEQKGVDVAIEAQRRIPGATLTLVGPVAPGYLTGRPLPEGVELRPPVPRAELADVYAEHDVCLFPVTWSEPFGMVPLESMAVGTPVVATGTGGSAEFLEDGVNCLLAEPGDPEALAGAVEKVIGDPALRARLVVGGRSTAERYSMERMGDQVDDVVREAAAGSGPAFSGAGA